MRRTPGRAVTGALALAVAVAGGCTDPAGGGDPAPVRTGVVTLTEVATADAPTAAVAGPGGTLWIAERAGRVRILGRSGLGGPVLDISDQTTTDGERGLLGIAFDPDFTHFYLSYTDLAGHNVLVELAVTGGQPRPETGRTLLTQQQPYANHNGGDLAFGPDRMLYFGLGDGGSGGDPHGNGQDLGTWLGKLLRIDPAGGQPYAVPDGNPFAGRSGARPEIWAYGLRNPWRFSFDAGTGDLWIGDVGQSTREEIDHVAAGAGPAAGAGANFGWSAMEGTGPFAGAEPADHVPPVFEYETAGNRCSVTGGYVYRGEAIPQLRGHYLFSDFCDGVIRSLELAGGRAVETDLGVAGGSVVAFGQGPDRELYVLDLAGPVYRIDPA